MLTLVAPIATRHDGYYLTASGEALACQLDQDRGDGFLQLTTIEPATIGTAYRRTQESVIVHAHDFAPIDHSKAQATLLAQDLASDAFWNYVRAKREYRTAWASTSPKAIDKATDNLEQCRARLLTQCEGFLYRMRWCENAATKIVAHH